MQNCGVGAREKIWNEGENEKGENCKKKRVKKPLNCMFLGINLNDKKKNKS